MSFSNESIFKPHGHFSVRVDDQILLTEVTGPWNLELVEYWAEQAFGLVRNFEKARPYVAVTVVHESMLCPPEALARVGKGVEYANHYLACIGHCIVAGPEVDGRDVLRFAYEKIGLGMIFESLDDAKAWALSRLASAQLEQSAAAS